MDSVCCRLCGLSSPDLVEIFGEQGVVTDYPRKIGRYLYLLVTPTDDLPKTLCRICSQQLETFHQFHEMIHGIQQQMLQERYSEYAINVHQEYVEDGGIEIFDQLVKEENVLADSYQPESHEALPIFVSDSQAAKQYGADDVLMPNANDEDSLLVVKTEQAVETYQPHNVETSVAEVDILEKRKSSRKPRISEHKRKNASRNQYDSGNDEKQIKMQQKPKIGNGLNINSEDKTHRNSPKETNIVLRKSTRKRTAEEAFENHVEGEESGDGSSVKSCNNEEWPAAESKDKFPTTIIKNGLLIMKSPELIELSDRFFNLLCDLCTGIPVGFKSVKELFGHYQFSHQQEGYVICCQKKIFRFPTIFMHMARHIQPDAFKCDICGYLVTKPRFLKTHRRSHLPDDQKPYACEHCPKRFYDERTYKGHLNTHKPPEERSYHVCPVCGKRYDSSSGLTSHKRKVHHMNDSRPTKVSHFCEICSQVFTHSSSMREHMAKYHQPREKNQVQCTVCSKWLINLRSLKVHMQLHKEEDVACDLCDYKTKKIKVLKRHMINKHQDEKPFPCEKCDHSFKHRQALTAHMRLKHNDGTRFQCNFCDTSFSIATNFYTHRKKRHPKELAAMREQAEAQRRLQRIKAGVEPDDGSLEHETTISGENDGISDPSFTMSVLDISKNEVTEKS